MSYEEVLNHATQANRTCEIHYLAGDFITWEKYINRATMLFSLLNCKEIERLKK